MNEFTDTEHLISIRDWVQWGAERFESSGLYFGHGTDNAFDESLSLVLHGLKLGYGIDESYLDTAVTDAQKQMLFLLLQRRITERLPAAYITGTSNFAGLPFYVNEHVLVPRSPIAELVVNGFVPWLPAKAKYKVLDLCTGSGCIGMACAAYLQNSQVDAADISLEALAVAKINLDALELSAQVALLHSDLFAAIPQKSYDLIVTNPPYVDAEDMAALPEEYRHEPALGLAAGTEGLDLVVQILREARQYLSADGIMVVEVGNSETHLQRRYPNVPFLWLEFEHGGHGVFLLTAQQLDEYEEEFQQ